MSAFDDQEAILRPLLAPGRYARALVIGALALALASGAHALFSVQAPKDPMRSLVRRMHMSDLALVPDEDLRHPGWGRSEQGRVGQPGLPDPRGAKTLVRTVPMKVSE